MNLPLNARALHSLVPMLKILLYLGAGWGTLLFKRWRRSSQEQKAVGWPGTDGTILSGVVAKIPKTTKYAATLSYFYFVGGYQSGEYTREFGNETDADDFMRQMKGRKLMVRYDEARPESSVVERSTVEQMVLLVRHGS